MMKLSHVTPSGSRGSGGRRGQRDERGYVLVMFALLLVPTLLMAGLSIDVGSWYNRTSEIRKAADAAALAGVVWLPDLTKASTEARAAAARNGFVDGADGITVGVTRSNADPRRLRVTITDTAVGSFFFKPLVGDDITLRRTGIAEYVLPVPLGSPLNEFGGEAYGFWGNIHGPRTDNKKGDAYAPACRASSNCGSTQNENYRPEGYLFTVDVPAGVSGLNVQVWDAGLYDRGSDESVDTGDRRYSTAGTTTTWTFYNKDNTELNVGDNVPAASAGICTAGGPGSWILPEGAYSGTYKNKWASICRRNGAIPPGRYLLRVQTSGVGDGANRYAIRVLSGSAKKARVSAYGDMSMFNNIPKNTQANFYLAEVESSHAGKTLKIEMYDPGEVSGSATMKIISPSGGVAASCVGTSTSPTSTFTSGSTLSPCQFLSSSGGARYDGHWVVLLVPIPNNYSCTSGTIPGCWWKVQYDIGGQATDTTTWTASVLGDPIHLIEEF